MKHNITWHVPCLSTCVKTIYHCLFLAFLIGISKWCSKIIPNLSLNFLKFLQVILIMFYYVYCIVQKCGGRKLWLFSALKHFGRIKTSRLTALHSKSQIVEWNLDRLVINCQSFLPSKFCAIQCTSMWTILICLYEGFVTYFQC